MKNLEKGDTYQEKLIIKGKDLDAFAILSGDINPIHMYDNYLPEKFLSRVAHGAYTMAIFSRIIGTEFPGYGTIYMSQNIHFNQPVYTNEEIEFTVAVERIIIKRYAILVIQCLDKRGNKLVDGEIEVELPHEKIAVS